MRRALLIILSVGIVVGGVFTGLVLAGAIGQNSSEEPAIKQTEEAVMAAEQATARAGSAPTKDPAAYTPVAGPQSCPIDAGSIQTQITGPFGQVPAFPEIFGSQRAPRIYIANQAQGVTTEGDLYEIFSGALTADPQQGVIVVLVQPKDPCAQGYGSPREYDTPFKGGAVSLKRVEGDMVDFQTADGTTGRLSYLTGTFISLDGTPLPTAGVTAVIANQTPVAGQ